MELEQKYSDYTAFVTLTYNDANLPLIDDDTGVSVLSKSDVQKWLKRFRKELDKYGVSVRYYVAGEYGETYQRPHYHALLFFKDGRNGEFIWKSPALLQQIVVRSWSLGIVDFQAAQSQGASMYAAKYVMKADDEFTDYMKSIGYPQFSLKSQGLGREYLQQNAAWYHTPSRMPKYYVPHNGSKLPMPRYFKSKLFPRSEKLTIRELEELNARMFLANNARYEECKRNFLRTHDTSELSYFEAHYHDDVEDYVNFIVEHRKQSKDVH